MLCDKMLVRPIGSQPVPVGKNKKSYMQRSALVTENAWSDPVSWPLTYEISQLLNLPCLWKVVDAPVSAVAICFAFCIQMLLDPWICRNAKSLFHHLRRTALAKVVQSTFRVMVFSASGHFSPLLAGPLLNAPMCRHSPPNHGLRLSTPLHCAADSSKNAFSANAADSFQALLS